MLWWLVLDKEMTKHYYEGFKLRDICENEGIKYEFVRVWLGKGKDLESLIRQPVLTHNGLFYGQPVHVHDCPDCVFMGHTGGFDLYSCNGKHGQRGIKDNPVWIIARFSSEPLDYTACRFGFAYKNILIIAENLYRGLNDGLDKS